MRFLKAALRALGGIYNPQGGLVTTDRIDLEGSVQLVHDVSREAEIASGIGSVLLPGSWFMGQADVHAGADEVYAFFNPRGVVTTGVPDVAPFDVWLLPGIYAWSATRSSIRICTSTLWYPAGLPGQVLAHQRLLYFSAQSSAGATAAGTSGGDVAVQGLDGAVTLAANLPGQQQLPILIPPGATIATRTVSLLASTIQIVHPMWVGPQGVLPPGMA